jgi:hypothetical protein
MPKDLPTCAISSFEKPTSNKQGADIIFKVE